MAMTVASAALVAFAFPESAVVRSQVHCRAGAATELFMCDPHTGVHHENGHTHSRGAASVCSDAVEGPCRRLHARLTGGVHDIRVHLERMVSFDVAHHSTTHMDQILQVQLCPTDFDKGHASFAWMANEIASIPAGLAQVPKLIVAGSLAQDHQPILLAPSALLVFEVSQVDRHTGNELGRGMPPVPLACHSCTFNTN